MTDRVHSTDRARTSDILVGAVALVLGLAALAKVPSEVSRDAFATFGNVRSPAFFPILASALLVFCACAILLRSLRAGRVVQAGWPGISGRALAVGGLLVAAGLAITTLGFMVTSCALIIALSYTLGARRHLLVLLLAVIVPTAILLLFRSVLDVLLPSGFLL